jgi:hypothetical protein
MRSRPGNPRLAGVKPGIVADVHGNDAALRAVLEDAGPLRGGPLVGARGPGPVRPAVSWTRPACWTSWPASRRSCACRYRTARCCSASMPRRERTTAPGSSRAARACRAPAAGRTGCSWPTARTSPSRIARHRSTPGPWPLTFAAAVIPTPSSSLRFSRKRTRCSGRPASAAAAPPQQVRRDRVRRLREVLSLQPGVTQGVQVGGEFAVRRPHPDAGPVRTVVR